jgi:arylsulfatase A-like enzyme
MVDHYVGQMVATLERTGQLDNTLIVFMSDHGDTLGDHGQLGKGPSNYEAIVRVPCILHWPQGLPRGREVEALVESIDIFPTLCDLCGVPLPKGVKGRSLSALLRGETEEGREDILIEFKDPRRGFSVKTLRTERYKYFRYHDGREKLYDLAEEPEEVFDRASDSAYRPALEELRDRLLTRLIEAEDDLPERTHDY